MGIVDKLACLTTVEFDSDFGLIVFLYLTRRSYGRLHLYYLQLVNV